MTEVASFQKNAREKVSVSLERYNGHDVLNIRVWFQTESGEWRPGKQGIALRQEKLPDLAEAIEAARRAVRKGAA